MQSTGSDAAFIPDKRTNRAAPWTARTPLEKREVVAATAVAATAAAAEDYWLDEISASSNMSLQHHQHQDDGGISSDHVFRRIDVNNKGYITRPELTDYVMKVSVNTLRRKYQNFKYGIKLSRVNLQDKKRDICF